MRVGRLLDNLLFNLSHPACLPCNPFLNVTVALIAGFQLKRSSSDKFRLMGLLIPGEWLAPFTEQFFPHMFFLHCRRVAAFLSAINICEFLCRLRPSLSPGSFSINDDLFRAPLQKAAPPRLEEDT